MAKETKVGLLAGLAFIICFAIILSNRGERAPVRFADLGTSPDRPRLSGRAQRPSATRTPGTKQPSQRSVTTPSGNVDLNVGLAKGQPATRRTAPPSKVAEDPPPSGGGELVVPHDARRNERSNGPTAQPVRTDQDAKPAVDRQQLLRERLDQIAADRGVERPSTTPSAHTQPPGPTPTRSRAEKGTGQTAQASPSPAVVVLARYEVQSGDTLSSIASRQYGSRARRFIDGIADANRAVVSDPNRIRPGMELSLPVIDGVKPAAAPSSAQPAAQEVRSPAGHSQPAASTTQVRWYQIRPNDRYVTIAREQLGDGSRWREIYELNIDKFPDPGLIRPGVRIKLPPLEVVSKASGREP